MSEHKPALAGKQVRTLEELDAARRERRAVICAGVPCFSMPRPAAVVIMLQGETLLRIFQRGLYYYEKPNRKKKGPTYFKTKKQSKGGDGAP